MRTLTAIVFGAALAVTPASAQTPAAVQALAARVEALEAQEAIRQLWADYGRTLDARDFAAFSTLWAREATLRRNPRGPGGQGAGGDRRVPGEGDRDQLSRLEGQELSPLLQRVDRREGRSRDRGEQGRLRDGVGRQQQGRLPAAGHLPRRARSRRTASGSSSAARSSATSRFRARAADCAQRAEGGRVTWSVTPLPHAGGGGFHARHDSRVPAPPACTARGRRRVRPGG